MDVEHWDPNQQRIKERRFLRKTKDSQQNNIDVHGEAAEPARHYLSLRTINSWFNAIPGLYGG